MDDLIKREERIKRQYLTSLPILAKLDEQIIAATPEEKVELLRVREEIIRQDRTEIEANRKASLESIRTYHQIISPWLLIGTGSAYIYAGFYNLGYFLIGAGVFLLAPRFVELWFKRLGDNKEGNDGKS